MGEQIANDLTLFLVFIVAFGRIFCPAIWIFVPIVRVRLIFVESVRNTAKTGGCKSLAEFGAFHPKLVNKTVSDILLVVWEPIIIRIAILTGPKMGNLQFDFTIVDVTLRMRIPAKAFKPSSLIVHSYVMLMGVLRAI